jgi:hypothetical protein
MPTACARTFIENTSAVQIQVVAPQDGLKKKMNKNKRKTIAIPTGSLFKSPGRLGVLRPIRVTQSIHTAIPNAPTMKRNFRPYRSAVHIAFKVNRMPKVAFRAFIRAILLRSGNTFL